jgi:predicted RNA-binding protein YlqC (UPF0109 family)
MSDQFPERKFLEYLLSTLLEHTDDIVLEDRKDDLGILFTLTVHEDDMGKLIGKGGQTIQAIRTILRMLGSKRQERINLKVIEPKEEA